MQTIQDSRDEDIRFSQQLVRRFSDQLYQENPQEPLSRGLHEKIKLDEWQEWNRRLRDTSVDAASWVPSDEARLATASQKLSAAWEKFQKHLPESKKVDVLNEPPDIHYLRTAVKDASEAWQKKYTTTKTGKAKTLFRSICNSVQAHKNVIGMLPRENPYFSLFCGALTTVVQATVQHAEIAEEVDSTLELLGDKIVFWSKLMKELSNEQMFVYITELYVEVFEFLAQIFQSWSKSSLRRFVTSLNETSTKKIFKERMITIERIEEKLKREAASERYKQQTNETAKLGQQLTDFAATLTLGHVSLEQSIRELGANFQKQLEQQAHTISLLQHYVMPPVVSFIQSPPPEPRVMERGIASAPRKQALMYHEEPHSREPSMPPPHRRQELTDHEEDGNTDSDMEEPPPVLPYDETIGSLQNLQLLMLQHLADIQTMIKKVSTLEIDANVQRRVVQWTQSQGDTLWIHGPAGVPRPSQNTATALLLSSSAMRSNIPHLKYFCGTIKSNSKRSWYNKALLNMLLCLVVQLVQIMPEKQWVPIVSDYSSRIRDESISFDEALELFISLRAQGPLMLMIIIDNLQELEERGDKAHTLRLQKFIHKLCKLNPKPVAAQPISGKKRVSNGADSTDDSGLKKTQTKICFTTDGLMDALALATEKRLVSKTGYEVQADERDADSTAVIDTEMQM